MGVTVLLSVSVLGSTLASNISLNGGENVEFGQGVAETTACDDSIIVTPIARFVNTENAGEHKFSGVTLSTIDSSAGNCDGKDFVIKAYSNSEQLDIFSNCENSYNTVRVFDDGGDFSLISDGSLVAELSNENNGNTENTSFTVTFNTPIADASDIEKITVESTEHVDTGIIRFGCSAYQLISNVTTWQNAYLDITTPVNGQCRYRRNGQCGYFAVISSDAERQAVIASVGTGALWLGGSDIEVEGTWKWIDGPEFGNLFSSGFTNWADGEPNDSGGNEDALQTYPGLDGKWNDLGVNIQVLPYLIEYSPNFTSRSQRLNLD